ncbi:MAG TPA: sensor histidine kinase [Clostridia bacterium]|nr:sensor histidine kinase [Clostridia bacterium]
MLLLSSLKYNEQYDRIVTNITNANSINGIVQDNINSEMWKIVAGKIRFEEGKQYEIINKVNDNIWKIMDNVSSDDNRTKLFITLRTMTSLEHYVNVIGQQIKDKRPVQENEEVLDKIRDISSLVESEIQEFMLYEVRECSRVKEKIEENVNQWVVTNLLVLGFAFVFSLLAGWIISGSITKPIKELRNMTVTVAEGNLDVRIINQNVDEVAALGDSFNIMIEKLKELIEKSKLEQENLKKFELKALQAQINPHFLYNTLDTIVWMAEANKSEQVIEIVKAFSSFFRITLSKGKDWIPVRNEIEHIRSYLTIQKIRYRDILDFSIDADENIMDCSVLKLTLQPIVENALYHGIKNKRGRGNIKVTGRRTENANLIFEVEDNGIGIEQNKLREIQRELENGDDLIINDSGFGLYNVQKRIKLYYGKQYGLKMESEHLKWTKVTITIPIRSEISVQSIPC